MRLDFGPPISGRKLDVLSRSDFDFEDAHKSVYFSTRFVVGK